MNLIDDFEENEECDKDLGFHEVNTITYGELIEREFVDWSSDDWKWNSFNDEQYKRVCKKFDEHYYWREIGILPLARFRQTVKRIFNEQMPKYLPFYQAFSDGNTLLQAQEEYGKNRQIYSDFPATQIKPDTQDYATNSTDFQRDIITNGDIMEKMKELKDFNDIDLALIEELEICFSSLLTENVNI